MYKRGDVWWTCIRYKGKKYQKSLETRSKKAAQAIEAKIRTAIIEGKYFDRQIGDTKGFSDTMEKFMKEHAPKVSENMQKSYASYLKRLKSFFDNKVLSEITPGMIYDYKVLRYGEGAKPATINRELAMLSKAFSLAVKEWEWIKEHPISKVPKEREDNERERWLTDEEEKRLLEHCPQWLQDIVVLDLHTGLRQGELRSLTWNRVNLSCKHITIERTENTKKSKTRTISLNQIVIDILQKKSNVRSMKHDYVFLSNAGGKIDRHNLRRAFDAAIKKADIKDFHFHDLRHTFATRLAQKGVDIYKISKLMGHQDIRMTQRYAHHCPESLRDGVMILQNDYNLTTISENGGVAKP